MSDTTWFIGSRRHYGMVRRREPLRRLDPSDFWSSSGPGLDASQRREYELEVLERVIAEIRDSSRDTTPE